MNLTETFDGLGAKEITEFIQLGQEEHLHLEFKTVSNANLRGGDDMRNLARCLSGFANSSGGIIVWGVQARKNAQGIDCATAPAEISPVRQFLSRLNEMTGEAVSPIVEGIRHKVIETTHDRGFAVTLVPQADSGPHMAKLGGEDRYYKRSGDSFYRMEHFDLEDMFGRRQKPHLYILLRNLPVPEDNAQEDLRFNLQNNGRAIARHAGFFARLENVNIVDVLGSLENVSHLNEGRPTVTYTKDQGVIHPNGIMTFIGHVRLRRTNPAENIIVEVTSYCENARTEKSRVELPPLERPAEAHAPA
jgi:predicted HTH transcriptional regulator